MGSNYTNKYKKNITEFYVAFTNRLIVIVIIAIITELTFVGFSNFAFSWDERNGVLRKLKHIFPNTYQRINSICSPAKGGTGCYRF